MKKYLLVMIMSVAVLAAFNSCKNETVNPPAPNAESLSGSITGTKTLDAKVTYTLAGALVVEEGGVLNIPAGTVIKSKKGFGNYILVLMGGKINVNGTADKPVIMTADDEANASSGYWGGLIINGKAKVSGDWTTGKTPTGQTEIANAYLYGGTDNADNSGSITYLIIKYPGARSSADIEHNGLTLNGVGNSTKIENLYIYKSADDGVEFFGGSVNITNLLVVNDDDDMFDFTQGYTGTVTNCYGIWEKGFSSTESDPRGIEGDGNLDGAYPNHTNQSDCKFVNATFDLRIDADANQTNIATQMMDVIKLRRGAKATITNALVKGTGNVKNLINFDDSKGAGNVASVVSLTNGLTNKTLVNGGKEIVPGKDANGVALSYPNAKIDAANTGCATTVFAWTGYKF